MDRTKKSLAYLDTHVVVWLFDSLTKKFPRKTIALLENNELKISPLVKLELQYLLENKKIRHAPSSIVTSLNKSIGLELAETPYLKVVDIAVNLNWTRDPFDRLLVAEAIANNAFFITKDRLIKII